MIRDLSPINTCCYLISYQNFQVLVEEQRSFVIIEHNQFNSRSGQCTCLLLLRAILPIWEMGQLAILVEHSLTVWSVIGGGSGKLQEVSFPVSQLAPAAACLVLARAGCSRDAGTAVGPVTEAVLQHFQDGCFLRQDEAFLLGRATAKSKGKVMFIPWECLRQPSSLYQPLR